MKNVNSIFLKFILRENYSMEQKPEQKERRAKLKPWK